MLRLFTCSFLCLMLSTAIATAATYRATFTGTWSADDITSSYPSSAHFTELIGATHTASTVIWENGGRATQGIENVAELGSNFALLSELQELRQAGMVGDTVEFRSLFNLPNSDVIEFEVDNDKPFLTLISMIAPSPDWFVGVSALPLTDASGNWVRSLDLGLRPYDAGTEEGSTFSLSNPPTTDGVISQLTEADSPFIGRPVIARLQLTLLDPLPPVDPPTEPPAPGNPGDENALILIPILPLLLDSE